MPYEPRNPLMPPVEEPPKARGGLASEAMGGLEKFMGNVTRGVDAVLSNPLYARLWSGAVSGMAQDPTAGPAALQALKQASQPSIQDELAYYRVRQMQRAEEDDARQRAARDRVLADPRNIDEATMAAAFPNEWASEKVKPPAQPKAPTQREMGLPGRMKQRQEFVGGQWVNVGDPYESGPMVEINNPGEPPKVGDVLALKKDYATEAARFRTAVEQLPLMRANADLGTGAGDLGLVVSVAKIRDPNSVVREGEIELVREDSSRFEDIRLAAKRLKSGQLLLPEQRRRLIESIEAEVKSLAPTEEQRRRNYGALANSYGVDPVWLFGEQSVDEMLRAAGIGQAQQPAGQPTPVRARPLP